MVDGTAVMVIADGMPLANLVIYIAGFVICAAIAAAKGNYWLLGLGVICPALWVVGAVVRAKPGSLWARVRFTYFDPHPEEDT